MGSMKVKFLVEYKTLEWTRELDIIPRIGETVFIDQYYYIVKDIIHNLDLYKKSWDTDITILLRRK